MVRARASPALRRQGGGNEHHHVVPFLVVGRACVLATGAVFAKGEDWKPWRPLTVDLITPRIRVLNTEAKKLLQARAAPRLESVEVFKQPKVPFQAVAAVRVMLAGRRVGGHRLTDL